MLLTWYLLNINCENVLDFSQTIFRSSCATLIISSFSSTTRVKIKTELTIWSISCFKYWQNVREVVSWEIRGSPWFRCCWTGRGLAAQDRDWRGFSLWTLCQVRLELVRPNEWMNKKDSKAAKFIRLPAHFKMYIDWCLVFAWLLYGFWLVASWLILLPAYSRCLICAVAPQNVACLITVAAWRCLVDTCRLLPNCCLIDGFLVSWLLSCFCRC